MPIFLKETLYSKEQFDKFSNVLDKKISNFDKDKFLSLIFDEQWKNRELKQRMRHVTNILNFFLDKNYEQATNQIIEITHFIIDKKIMEKSFIPISLADYIEVYGIEFYDNSIKTIEEVTKLASCEFAVRPFIVKYKQKMMQQMLAWSQHKHKNVRRLSSEGCRPRLPWATALHDFKKNPSLILPILENLKNDSSKFVQKSVANNLNDISKDHPEILLSITNKWIGKSKNTDWILKHACRTLLKKGNMQAMKLFGYSSPNLAKIKNFKIQNNEIEIGKNLEFSFNLINISNKEERIRVEFALYFLRSNGSHSKKVFKINENIYKNNSNNYIIKKHSFKLRTTRRYYSGEQKISIIINGNETNITNFYIK